MKKFDFSQSIGIYGMGVEGSSLFSWLKKHGAEKVFCFNDSTAQKEKEKISQLDIVFRSPGVHPKKLEELGVEKEKISSVTQLFFQLSPTKNTIGITGTKGKGTTSSLLFEMLHANEKQKNVFLGGNIGTPVFDFFDEIEKDDIVVLELSSFQLYGVNDSPHVSVLLRTDEEHLDWHIDVNDYRNAKRNIFLHQKEDDVLVYFAGSEIVKNMLPENPVQQKISTFSRDEKNWIDIENREIISSFFPEKYSTKHIALRGDFHQENVLAAIAVAKKMGVKKEVIEKTISLFAGLPMRCELVHEKGGVSFFNDSFSTIPQTTISALSTFSSPVYLILGGSGKNSDFTVLADYISKRSNIKKIYLVGKEGERIQKYLQDFSVLQFEFFDTFESVFSNFLALSQKGDSLLLSPGCTSFGMFENYKKRGEAFNLLAKKFFTI